VMMMRSVSIALIACSLFGLVLAIEPLSDLDVALMFTNNMVTYSKTYSNEMELQNRFQIFRNNLNTIRLHNSRGESWQMGVNQFTDMTPEELSAVGNTELSSIDDVDNNNKNDYITNMPAITPLDSIDWRTKGAVTPIVNQGQVGDVLAIATVGSIESWYYLKNGSHGIISQLSYLQVNKCAKGSSYIAYVKRKGLCGPASHDPTGQCHDSTCTPVLPAGLLTGTHNFSTEAALVTALNTCPVTVYVDASRFASYSSGVFSGPCGTTLNHAIVIVGYGDAAGVPYWIAKNSWGTAWGEQGYIRLIRGKEICGIGRISYQPY